MDTTTPERLTPEEAYAYPVPLYRLDPRVVLCPGVGQPLFDREIIPLLNAVTELGITTTGSCAGHPQPGVFDGQEFSVSAYGPVGVVSGLLDAFWRYGRDELLTLEYNLTLDDDAQRLGFMMVMRALHMSTWTRAGHLTLLARRLGTERRRIQNARASEEALLLRDAIAAARASSVDALPPARRADSAHADPYLGNELWHGAGAAPYCWLLLYRPDAGDIPVRPGLYASGAFRVIEAVRGPAQWTYVAHTLSELRRKAAQDWPTLGRR